MTGFGIIDFPVSLILAVAFLVSVYLLSLWKKSRIVSIFGSRTISCVLLGLLAAFLGIEGTLGIELHHSWSFLTAIFFTMISLGISVLSSIKTKNLSYILSHFGLFTILFGGFFGAPDFVEGQILIGKESPSQIAVSEKGNAFALPFEMTLKDFRIDYYEDGESPRQFTSEISFGDRTLSTSVNHPCHYKGYSIYQADYDSAAMQYSVLKVVKDPWIFFVYLGIILLSASAILGIMRTWHGKKIVPIVILLAVIFTVVSVVKINFGCLMPALRSFWFVPHLLIYMLAYSIMAISLVIGIISIISPKVNTDLPKKLLASSSYLLILGMLCGAAWAKAAWGDYWTWDAKENWAAVTWLLTLLGSHFPTKQMKKSVLVLIISASFLSMQITWYGVNYLPSSNSSLHTYNQ